MRTVRFRPTLGAALLLCLTGCTTRPAADSPTPQAPSERQTLRIGLLADPPTLDPAKVTDIYTADVLAHCYETLVRVNAKNEIEPALAERWEVSPDGKVYTFTLRNATFHNGQPLTGNDVKYSWERAVNPKLRSSVAANYLEGILGVREAATGKLEYISGVHVIDERTVRIFLDRPRAYFLGMLAYSSNAILNMVELTADGGGFNDKIKAGTGAFQIENYQPGQQVTLKAHPTYWGGAPMVARIEYPIVVNADTAYNKFRANGLDILEGKRPRYSEDRAAGLLQAEYQVVPSASIQYLAMHPVAQPAFAKRAVRQAFSRAIDRAEIIRTAYKNLAKPVQGFVPPDMPGRGADPPPIPYDPAEAKRLLANAGFPDGRNFPALTLVLLQQDVEGVAAAQIIAANLKENLNINVTVQEREMGQFLEDINKGKLGFYMGGWFADYIDAQDFLSTLFVSNAPLNRFGYRNPTFDAYCRRADESSDPAERAKNYSLANRLLMEEVGVLPLVSAPRLFLVQQNVQGWSCNLANPLPNLRTMKR